jgi:sugar phosphate isomerase/epimerase
MYLSCSTCVESHRPLPEALDRIAELGFEFVDLIVIERMQHIQPSDLAERPDEMIPAIAEAVLHAGLKVSSLNCGLSVRFSDDPDALDQIEREWSALLRLAEEVGCSLLTMQLGGYNDRIGRVEAFDRGRAGLRQLLDLAGDRQIRLSFEPHSGSPAEKPADALYLAKRLWPGIGITYDPSHFEMQPDVSLKDSEMLLDYTMHVHVRNAALARMQAPMDEGTVDFAWLISALRKRDYSGAVAIEYLDGAEADALKLRDPLIELGVSPHGPKAAR